jgi:hypothetical protein
MNVPTARFTRRNIYSCCRPRSSRRIFLPWRKADLYREHIAVEEREIFPVAAAVLGKFQREAMGGEMAARRGLRQSP